MPVQINVNLEKLQGKSLMCCVPMYGGQCFGTFTKASNDLIAVACQHQVNVRFYYLFNESLITRARNYCVDEFRRSDCSHLMFIDSDIGFEAMDVLAMLAMMSEEDEEVVINGNTFNGKDFDIMCGPYPKKCISWEKIKAASDMGVADNDPNVLEKYVGDYVFNPAAENKQLFIHQPGEILEGGTGFMMMRRSAIERFASAYPELNYRPDHVRTAAFDGSRPIMCMFDAVLDNKHSRIKKEIRKFFELNPEAGAQEVIDFIDDTTHSAFGFEYSNRYLSEDYMFCQWARAIGLKVWLAPWIRLTHTGTYQFAGSLEDIAAIGVSATADPTKLGTRA